MKSVWEYGWYAELCNKCSVKGTPSCSHFSFKHGGIITHLELGLDMIWTARKGSPRIQIWDTEQGKLHGSLPCDDAIRKQYV